MPVAGADLDAFRAEWSSFLATVPIARLKVVAHDARLPPQVSLALDHLLRGHSPAHAVATFRAARPTIEATVAAHQRAYPHEHTRREGNGVGDAYVADAPAAFRWRHTWTHCETGDRIVATVPVPPSRDAFEDDHGLVALRFLPAVGAAEAVARLWPSARVEIVTRASTTPNTSLSSATSPTLTPSPTLAPTTTPAPTAAPVVTIVTRGDAFPVASMTYGEGMF
jgi:hypothetical protein